MQQFTQAWLTLVIDISIKSILLACVAGLALCLLRVRDTNLRHRVWTAVLLGMLAMPALVYVTPAVPLPGWLTRMIPSSATTDHSIAEQTDTPIAARIEKNLPRPADETPNPLDPAALVKSTGNELPLPTHGALPVPPLADLSTANSIADTRPSLDSPASGALNASRVSLILAGLYFFVAIVFLGRLLLGLTLTYRIIRQAREIHLSTPLSLPRRRNLRLLESDAVHVPATVGCMRPVVLLPRCWPQWSEAKLRAVLAHELAHLECADWLVITLAELNRAVYWFHPLAWFVRNRLSELAEQNCDDAVLAADGDRTQYARYLLEVAGSLTTAGARYRPPRHSIAMARKPNVETRIEAILDSGRPLARRLGAWGIACLIAIGIPAILLSAALRASSDDVPSITAPGAMKSATKSDESSKQSPAVPQNNDEKHVAGRVVGPTGEPLAGATVFAGWTLVRRDPPSNQAEHKILAQTKTDAQGNYELTFSTVQPDMTKMTTGWQITAFAAGLGPAWRRDIKVVEDIAAKAPTNLALVKDSPIRGRLVDLEGKPLAGVQVRINSLRPAESEQAIADWIQDAKEKSPPGNINQYFSSSANQMARRGSPFPGEFPAVWNDGRLEHHSLALPADVVTESEGRFEFKQLGENRLAILEIEGPAIAKSMVHVVNRAMETVSAKPLESNGVRSGVYYGRDFQFVAEPAQAIEGTVTDTETGKPLANLEVHIEQFAGNLMAQRDFLATRTDEQGHYRLAGAPHGGGHRIEVVPAVDQPYFPTHKKLAAVTGFDPITCEFALTKGRWIVGKVTDSKSGEPVGEAYVEYLPLRTNEEAKNYPNYDPVITGSAPSNRFRTTADGSFRVLAIPGAGILAAIAPRPNFFDANKMEKRPVYISLSKNLVNENLVLGNGTLATYHPWTITGYHALRQVELAKSDREVSYDLQFNRGLTRTIKFVDRQGQPVQGASVMGREFPPNLSPPLAESTVELIGLRPNDERDVVCIHRQRRIGKALLVSPGDEMSVTFEPCAVVRGRVIDDDKKPVRGLNIGVSIDHPDNWHRALDGSTTDDDGRFEVLLPPGTKYRVAYYAPNGKPIREISAECEAKPGVVFELGDLTNGAKLTAEQTEKLIAKDSAATNNAATSAAKIPSGAGGFTGMTTITAINVQPRSSDSSQPTQGNGKSAEPIQVTGHVLDERGAAVANVRVVATQSRWIDQHYLQTEHRQVAETRSRDDGSFTITVQPLKPVDYNNRQLTFDWKPATIMAVEPGRLSSWVGGGEFPNPGENPFAGDLVLHLDRHSTPIQGRLVSLEGQPLSGLKVGVKMLAIAKPKSVEPWLAVAEQKRRDGSLPPLKSGAGTLTLSSFSNAMVWDSSMTSASSSPEPKWSPYYPMTSRLLPQHPQLSAGAKTNVDGRFEIEGLPTDSLAVLEISGPGVETHTISVINREFQRLDVPGTGYPGAESNAYYGAKFDHPVPPGVSLVGTVTEKESAKPIVGAQVSASVIENQMLRNQSQWTSVSGPNGEYRIDGLPLGGKKEVDVVPAAEQPYLVARDLDAPDTAAGKPVSMEIKLRRGVLVHGRVTDAETGAPVKAVVQYNPLLSNEHARDFGYDPQLIRFDPGEDRQHTDADGVFHTVVIPGQGILGVQCDQWNDYCAGLGGEKMEVTADGRFATYNLTAPKAFNAVAQIDVPASAQSIERDLKVSRGINLKVNARDPQGQPLKGVMANGLLPFGQFGDAPASDATLEFKALRPGETRRAMLLHRGRHLGQIFELTAPEKGGAPEARTVTLEPCGTVTGRIIDGDKQPVAGVQLTAFAGTPRNFDALVPQQVATADDGKFRFEFLPPGANYNISGFSPQFNAIEVAKEMKLAPGETVDFGTIDIASKARPEPKRTAAKAEGGIGKAEVGAATSAIGGVTNADDGLVTVRGRVFDPQGKSVTGAKVLAIYWHFPSADHAAPVASTKSDDSGRFELSYRKSQLDEVLLVKGEWRYATIVAAAENYGPAWIDYNEMPTGAEATLKLTADEPIEGRIVNLEGQPITGVRVTAEDVQTNQQDDLSKWIEGLRTGKHTYKTEGSGTPDRGIALAIPQLRKQTVTGKDGIFRLAGIGRNRVASLTVSGPGVTSTRLRVATLPTDPLVVNIGNSYIPDQPVTYYGAHFQYAAEPSQPIEGTVRDAKTKTPLAGVQIRAERLSGQRTYVGDMLKTVSDQQGRYRLDGMPKGEGNRVLVTPIDQPYFLQEFAIPSGAGLELVKFDIGLERGVWIEGRVTEKTTGQPVRANMFYVPWPDNPHAEQGLRRQFGLHKNQFITDREGHFKIVGTAGRGLVAAFCIDRPFPGVQGLGEVADLPTANEFRTVAAYSPTDPETATAIKEVRIDENAKSVTANMPLDPGSRVTIRAVDPTGQPLSVLTIRGVTPRGFQMDGGPTGPTAEIVALSSDEKRVVALFHKGRNLGKVIHLGVEDAKGAPITVVLQPCATLTGRLLDKNGDSLRGEVEFSLDDRSFALIWPEVVTDMQGRFTNKSMLPGGEYGVNIGLNRIAAKLTVAPGETIDLGEFDVTSNKRPEPIHKQASSGAAKPTMLALANTSENAPLPAAKDVKRLIVHGRIVGVDGKPAAGADVAAIGMKADNGRGGDLEQLGAVLAEAKTNSDGAYRLEILGASSKTHRNASVIARTNGAAVAWKKLNLDAVDVEAAFGFKPEQVISGRLVDIDGQPAARVRLQVASIMMRLEVVAIMNRVVEGQLPEEGVGFLDCPKIPAAWPQPIIADDQGRFTVHGVSKNDGISLDVEANDRFAPQSIALNTGMAEQRGERDGTYRSLVKNLKPGEEGVLPLAPAQLFTGTVRFEDTGEPAPKARLTIWASQQNFGSMAAVAGKADDQGKYKINPNPGIRFGVTAYPPDGAPYLVRQVQPIAWQSGDRSREVDVKLSRGVLVRGKVLEQGSDAPIAGTSIQYIPETANNPNKPAGVLTGWQDIHVSDAEGRFQIVVLPGPGRLLVHGPQNDFVFQESSQRELYQGRAGGQRNYAHGIERIEPAANAEPVEVNFHLKPGGALTGELVDEQGAAVKDASMLSRLQISPLSLNWRGFPTPVLDGRFELTGLAADQEYPVYFLESKRRLGATLLAKSGVERPRVVLKPCGDAKMRFVDTDGKPIAGYEPMVQIVVTPGELNLVRLNQNNGTLTADADFIANVDRVNHAGRDQSDREGRLTVPALIPGATYRVVVMRNKAWSMGKELVAKAGETIDLGDITVERPE